MVDDRWCILEQAEPCERVGLEGCGCVEESVVDDRCCILEQVEPCERVCLEGCGCVEESVVDDRWCILEQAEPCERVCLEGCGCVEESVVDDRWCILEHRLLHIKPQPSRHTLSWGSACSNIHHLSCTTDSSTQPLPSRLATLS